MLSMIILLLIFPFDNVCSSTMSFNADHSLHTPRKRILIAGRKLGDVKIGACGERQGWGRGRGCSLSCMAVVV